MPVNTEDIFYINSNPPVKSPPFHPVPIIEAEGHNRWPKGDVDATWKSPEGDFQGTTQCHFTYTSGAHEVHFNYISRIKRGGLL
jgi:hypothetical protein